MSPFADPLSQTFAALSDPTRRAMLARLLQGEATVNELAAPFKMSLPAISKHIKVLEKAGLLIKSRQAQQRPCRINGEQLRQAMVWIEAYQPLWGAHLEQTKATPPKRPAAEPSAQPKRIKAPRSADSKPGKSKTGNAPAQLKPRAEKRARSAKHSEKPRHSPSNPSTAKEQTDDNALQQQIGFDF